MRALLLLGLFSLSACAPEHDWPRQCPSPNNDKVHYYAPTWQQTREDCAAIFNFTCPTGTESLHDRFPDRMQAHDCGCGCFGDIPEDWAEEANP